MIPSFIDSLRTVLLAAALLLSAALAVAQELDVAPGQTMADAYDAVIFLAPLRGLHQTAFVGSIHTPEFRDEVARRLTLLYS